jgi:hypothetical protein
MEEQYRKLEKSIVYLLTTVGLALLGLFIYFEAKEGIPSQLSTVLLVLLGTQIILIFCIPFLVNVWLPIDRKLPPPFNFFFSFSLAIFIQSILFSILKYPGGENMRTISTAMLVPSFFFGVVQVVLRKVDGGWYLREKPFLIIGWIIIPLLEVLLAVSMGY